MNAAPRSVIALTHADCAARTFARRFNTDIYAFRIGNVMSPDQYTADWPKFLADPVSRKRNAWSYIDARDLGQMCHRALLTSGLGFQVFNATNDTITVREKTKDFLTREYPHVEITRELEEYEAPLSNRKIRQVLGFKEEHNWRKYVQ